MLNFDNAYLDGIFTAFIEENEAKNPLIVSTDELVDQLIISRIIKNFKKTVKWFVPTDDSKISFITNEMFPYSDQSDLALKFTVIAGHVADNINNPYPGEFIGIKINNVSYFDYFTQAVLFIKINQKDAAIFFNQNRELKSIQVLSPIWDQAALFINVGDNEIKVASIDLISKKTKSAVSEWNHLMEIVSDRDEYFYTGQIINFCADFTKTTGALFGNNAADKADLNRRILYYFQDSTEFDITTFEKLIFPKAEEASKFNEKMAEHMAKYSLDIPETLDISKPAVKDYGNLLSSRIKLDSNFTIQMKGRRDLIETGFDEASGKKFYKISYDQEM